MSNKRIGLRISAFFLMRDAIISANRQEEETRHNNPSFYNIHRHDNLKKLLAMMEEFEKMLPDPKKSQWFSMSWDEPNSATKVNRVDKAVFLYDDPDDYLSDEMIPVHYLRRFDVHGVISGDHFLSTMTDEEFKAAVDKRIAKRREEKKEDKNPNDPF